MQNAEVIAAQHLTQQPRRFNKLDPGDDIFHGSRNGFVEGFDSLRVYIAELNGSDVIHQRPLPGDGCSDVWRGSRPLFHPLEVVGDQLPTLQLVRVLPGIRRLLPHGVADQMVQLTGDSNRILQHNRHRLDIHARTQSNKHIAQDVATIRRPVGEADLTPRDRRWPAKHRIRKQL